MTEPVLALAPCLPVDQSVLPDIGIPLPGPYVDDRLGHCRKCDREIWIGPKKLAASRAKLCLLVCYLCMAAMTQGYPEDEIIWHDLDPGRVEIRRTP